MHVLWTGSQGFITVVDLIIIINSLYLCRDRRTDRTKNKQYNSKFTIIVEVNVNLQSSVQVWFNANIVLVINFLSKMLVLCEGIWRSWGRFRRLYECDFKCGTSGASTWVGFATT